MSAEAPSRRALLTSAGAAILLSAGSVVAIAAPSLGATTTSTTRATATTQTTRTTQTTSTPPATTSSGSGSTGSSSTTTGSTSCSIPRVTSYPAGTVLQTLDFEDGLTGPVYAPEGVTLTNTTEAAQSGTHSLRVDGLGPSNWVWASLTSGTSFGRFLVTAYVRLPAGSPPTWITMVGGGSVLATSDASVPVTWKTVQGDFTPTQITADYLCNGSMTGTILPSGISAQFRVDQTCNTGPVASSVLLDNISVKVLTSGSGTSTSTGPAGTYPGCTPATTTTTTTTVATPPTCKVGYRVDGRWPGGFIATVTVKNTGTTPIPAWSLSWTYPDAERITQIWQATATQNGSDVTVRPVPATSSLPAGGSATFGFLGDTGNPQVPTAFTLSGRNCSVG